MSGFRMFGHFVFTIVKLTKFLASLDCFMQKNGFFMDKMVQLNRLFENRTKLFSIWMVFQLPFHFCTQIDHLNTGSSRFQMFTVVYSTVVANCSLLLTVIILVSYKYAQWTLDIIIFFYIKSGYQMAVTIVTSRYQVIMWYLDYLSSYWMIAKQVHFIFKSIINKMLLKIKWSS
jgi:hypothetical protein